MRWAWVWFWSWVCVWVVFFRVPIFGVYFSVSRLSSERPFVPGSPWGQSACFSFSSGTGIGGTPSVSFARCGRLVVVFHQLWCWSSCYRPAAMAGGWEHLVGVCPGKGRKLRGPDVDLLSCRLVGPWGPVSSNQGELDSQEGSLVEGELPLGSY